MSASHRGDGLGEGLVCASMRRTVAARLVQWPSRWPFIGPPPGPATPSLPTSGRPPPPPPPPPTPPAPSPPKTRGPAGANAGPPRQGAAGAGRGPRPAGHLVLALGAAFKPRHA